MRLALVLMLCAAPALGQPALPSVEDLVDGLEPAARARAQPPAAQGAAPSPMARRPPPMYETTAPPEVTAVSLTVHFPTGSAQLTPLAEAVLDRLGYALASPRLAGFRFRVEGHTDEDRAATVRNWLLARHGIAPQRIQAVGFGEHQLLVPTPDEMPEARNRRVQVLNLGS